MTKHFSFLICAVGILFSLQHVGCITYQETAMMQESANIKTRIIPNKPVPYALQPNDVVSVKVKSLNADYSDYLNLQSEESMINFTPLSMYVNGYSVDETGYVDIPVIGRVMVGGKTLSEAKEIIQGRVDENLNDAKVFVNLVSFRVSVLGEVQNPGYFYINNNQVTILEAVAMAGGVLEFGNRETVKLVRQVKEGSLVTQINLTDKDLAASEFFFLQPSDAIYIEPLEKKSKRSNLANATLFQAVFSGVSAFAATLTAILLITRNP